MRGLKAYGEGVSEFLDRVQLAHVVLSLVAKGSSGGPELLDAAGLSYLRDELLKRASVITPNVAEAELLAELEIKDLSGMKAAVHRLAERGARDVVITGGHLEKPIDVLYDAAEMLTFGGDRVKSPNTHGSGCTFSSSIAAQLASGKQLRDAVMLAKAYVTKAIEKSFSIGKGPGPLNHFYRTQQEPAPRGIHVAPQRSLHPAAEPSYR
jgi:hydroxymethylpyrimidine/phosphomethylpyrimidine kinase